MTEQEIKDRLSELYAKQAAATGWGAAVGARHEEIKSLEGQLAALRRPSTDTAEAELKSVRQQIVNFVDSGAQDSEPIKVTNGDLCRWFDRLEIVSALLRAPAQSKRISGATDIVDEAACLIWAELCPGMVMGDDDRQHYENAAKAVLALTSTGGNTP